MSSRAMAMSASSRQPNLGTALLSRPTFTRSRETSRHMAQRMSADNSSRPTRFAVCPQLRLVVMRLRNPGENRKCLI
jgi:hypothetical protein